MIYSATFVPMLSRRYHISVVLMLLAILAVGAFQVYWLNKNYVEEQQLLQIKTNVLFREAVGNCQLAQLKLDSNIKVGMSTAMENHGPVRAIRMESNLHDTNRMSPVTKQSVMITVNEKSMGVASNLDRLMPQPDSIRSIQVFKGKSNMSFIRILQSADSTQDSLRVDDIEKELRSLFAREKIALPFFITRKASTIRELDIMPDPSLKDANEMTVGFYRPITFKLNLEDTTAYILKRLGLPILVSFLLVGLTILSFVLLLRNLIQQRKLTRIKNEFISNITHELKTPIATVSVAIEAMKNFNALQDPARTREYLDISGNELQRLSLLVDKVLKLSMFEKQEVEVRPENFDLKVLVEEVTHSMRLQLEKYGAQVQVDATGADTMIRADRLHITSVIFNLLDNALKYSKAHPSIQVSIDNNSTETVFSVTDNGIGIPAEYKNKVFEKFFRVPSGDTHNVKGYGLGLSYVAHVIHQHKGTIQVESQPGIGTKFIIKIPRNA